ncbi:phosphate-starvation-inducible PsiE family protein [Candidatus Synechococcus calcipolaris G9]|uniref:Phosphate-starvation-inducible PsiE family protein n=1 Tax=Candidatus Synechococcus calcipolaris G9 TaxID=1497997 RepID=A0ABT6EV94_9SYNE|nr:phosphate-starvation-inducible PsiE family protein [Candidatus Synechococcus calcipolaris]MDG2989739.1 phosphate-starvation-inducible PsiE family protein [Candidatus Synechococcus calcipolaris G9]
MNRRANRLATLVSEFMALFYSDEKFLRAIKQIEGIAIRALAVGMLLVVLFAIVDLGRFLTQELFIPPYGQFTTSIVKIFGLFLNVLVALEILENITAYLKTHVSSQIVELVIVTSLIAIARKIIILDINQDQIAQKLLGLAFAVLALSISYWMIRRMNLRQGRS